MSAAGFDASVLGRAVVDAAGEHIGQVSALYLDRDTGVVSFAGVAMIRRGRRRIVLVPLAGATLGPASIAVTCGKLLARRAPSVRPGETLPSDAEPVLFAHYDMPYVPRKSSGGRRLTPYI
jgi:hypothetical protein